MGANMSGVTTSWNALVAKIRTTVEPLYKGHPKWWPFKRGGLSWGVNWTWFVKNGAWKLTKFCNFSETFLAFHMGSTVLKTSNIKLGIIFCSSDIWNHWQLKCLLNSMLRRTTKKAPKVHIHILSWREPGGFSSQRAINAESVSIS